MSSTYEQSSAIYYRNCKEYKLFPGETCIVDPESKSVDAEKVRNRFCKVIKILNNGKAIIRYLDSNRRGSQYVYDLVPQKKPISIDLYKLTKTTNKTEK